MINLFTVKFAGRFGSLQFSGLMLIALLQRTPVLRVLATAESVWVSSSLGQVLKATTVVASMLGAVDTLAGATGFVFDPASNPAEATVGVPFAVTFACIGGVSSADSYLISNLPPGLSVPSSFTSTNGRGLNSSLGGGITGTPTQAGGFVVTITAFDDLNLVVGRGSITSTYVINVEAAEVAPEITTQPSNLIVTAGEAAMFTVAASGSPAPAFQWRKGGVDINGATNATYTIATTVSGDAGTFTVFVSNGVGSGVTSNGATLTVNPANSAPAITTQPTSQSITAGSSVTFTAAASGTPTPTFQWKKGGVDIGGATSSTYSITSVSAGDAGSYTVVATNSVNSATSNAATLTVNPANTAPVITIQPESQTVTAGSSVSFIAAASGTPTPTFQWKKGGVEISGATSATFIISSPVVGDAGSYTVVATNVVTSTTSNAAILTVNAAPAAPLITTQPIGQTVIAGDSVTFLAGASGNPAPTFQWQKNGVDIAGATNSSYTIVGVTGSDSSNYKVVATNATGSASSNGVVLVVIVAPSGAIIAISVE